MHGCVRDSIYKHALTKIDRKLRIFSTLRIQTCPVLIGLVDTDLGDIMFWKLDVLSGGLKAFPGPMQSFIGSLSSKKNYITKRLFQLHIYTRYYLSVFYITKKRDRDAILSYYRVLNY